MAPLINDVTTDLEDVPEFSSNAKLNPLAEATKNEIRKGYPSLKPLLLSGVSQQDAFGLCLEAAKKMPRWKIVHEDSQGGVLEGFATTFLLRFKDDFVVRVREENASAKIDMRSKSRVGKGDLGANASRIETFFKHVQQLAPAPALRS